jgi:Trypsin
MKRTLVPSASSRPVAPSDARPATLFSARGTLLALALPLAVACSERAPLTAPSAGANEDGQEIIGGFAANDPRLDAVGSLVIKLPPVGGRPRPPDFFCSASLIAPETVLTAKHCAEIIPLAAEAGLPVAFALGPDSTTPRAMVDIVAIETAPLNVGSFIQLGSDVAVVHLERPLVNEPKVGIGTLAASDLGKPFVSMGYGVQDNTGRAGTRRVGRETMRAMEGKFFEIIFGSFDRFFEWATTGRQVPGLGFNHDDAPAPADGGPPVGRDGGAPPDGPPSPPSLQERARRLYDETLLLKDYEALTGGRPGDAQSCYGDSGSPLIGRANGQSVAYGVVSWGLGSRNLICDYGTVYASFGPTTLPMIQNAMSWTDPCGDLDTAGSCDGSVARRCTNLLEGPRRVVEFDCGLLGLECNTSAGQVACGDSPQAPPPPPASVAPGKEPDFRAIVGRKASDALRRQLQ